jgi:branched-chain amino acid transport system permease protein
MTTLLSIIVFGTVVGSIYGIAALGLVLTYRISGVFNFGHGAIAMFAAYVYYQLHDLWGVPAWLSAIVVVCVLAPAFGWLLDRSIFRPLGSGPVVVRIVVTAAIFVVLVGAAGIIWKGKGRGITPVFPRAPQIRLPAGVVVTPEQLGIIALGAAISYGLYELLRRTRLGIQMRAVVDDRDLAGLHRIDAGRVSTLAWAMGTALAALAGVLIAPIVTLDTYTLPLLVIAAYAAAVIAYLRSLPGAIAAAIAIGLADQTIALKAHSALLIGLRPSLPFIALVFVLVTRTFVLPKLRGETFQVVPEGAALADVRSPAPDPRRRAAVAALIALGLVAPAFMSASNRYLMGTAAASSLIALSLVLLIGYSGQISLGQLTFAAVGAFTLAHLSRAHVPFVPALAIAGLAAVPVGAAVAVLASRLIGLYLALATLALALMADQFFSNILTLTGGPSGLPVPRPSIGGLRFDSDLRFYYFAVAVLGLAMPASRNLLRGKTGRILAAMRDSETAAKTIGIDLFRAKVVVFSLSAFLAGIGGALGASSFRTAVMTNYNPVFSIFFLAIVVVGGVVRPEGAIVAGLLGAFGQKFLGAYAGFTFGVFAILLARVPQGLLALTIPSPRRRATRWIEIAVRRHAGDAALGADSGLYR